MTTKFHSRSPQWRQAAQVLGFIAFFIAILCCWLAPVAAHAASINTHHRLLRTARPHHPSAYKAPRPTPSQAADPQQDDDPSQLTPEQRGIIDWVLDSATPKMGYEQARHIVTYSYEKAKALGIDPLAFLAIMRLESRFNPHAVSREGAQGLMQVRYKVHKAKFEGRSGFDPQANMDVGAQILGDCLTKYGNEIYPALNCYSGGGGAAYHVLFQHFHHQVNRYVIFTLFDTPPEDVPSSRPPDPPPLPDHEEAYEVALK